VVGKKKRKRRFVQEIEDSNGEGKKRGWGGRGGRDHEHSKNK